jgi:hypothetical protein
MLYNAGRISPRGLHLGSRLLRRVFHYDHPKMRITQYAQHRDLQYWSETVETERINDMLDYYGLRKWGFVIYRCTYDDDSAWDRFMQHLNARKDAVLIDTYDDERLAQHLDWNVQQDPSLDRATTDQVRERFKTWVATDARAEMPTSIDQQHKLQGLLHENPRYKYCIRVDAEAMQSVLDGPPPNEPDLLIVSYVHLIRADYDWCASEEESAQLPATKVEDDPQYGCEPEIEGRTTCDVGWMKVSVDGLVPDVYELLVKDQMWEVFYVRPNEGVMQR